MNKSEGIMTTGDKLDWKELYYRAMANAKRRAKSKQNWVFVTDHGVGSTKARAICKALGVHPEETEFKRKQETQND